MRQAGMIVIIFAVVSMVFFSIQQLTSNFYAEKIKTAFDNVRGASDIPRVLAQVERLRGEDTQVRIMQVLLLIIAMAASIGIPRLMKKI